MASVRFICGTQEVHKELEARLSAFLGQEDTILYSSCFDANGGVFETLLGAEDAVISDALNHASIIDGIRLSKARRFRYANRDLADLEQQLKEAAGARRRLIVTDGVFSMDGYVAPLREICDLADRYDAMVMVDDSHAVGFVGPGGRGTPELHGVMDRVDIITGTLGKALGGASGGYVAARAEIVALLRQRSRPYLFSNTLAPVIAAASLKVLDLLESADDLRVRLAENTALFRSPDDRGGLRHPPRRPRHRPGDDRRRGRRRTHGGAAPGARRVRDRLLVPGGAAGPGPHPRPAVRRALDGGREPRGGRLRRGAGGAGGGGEGLSAEERGRVPGPADGLRTGAAE